MARGARNTGAALAIGAASALMPGLLIQDAAAAATTTSSTQAASTAHIPTSIKVLARDVNNAVNNYASNALSFDVTKPWKAIVSGNTITISQLNVPRWIPQTAYVYNPEGIKAEIIGTDHASGGWTRHHSVRETITASTNGVNYDDLNYKFSTEASYGRWKIIATAAGMATGVLGGAILLESKEEGPTLTGGFAFAVLTEGAGAAIGYWIAGSKGVLPGAAIAGPGGLILVGGAIAVTFAGFAVAIKTATSEPPVEEITLNKLHM